MNEDDEINKQEFNTIENKLINYMIIKKAKEDNKKLILETNKKKLVII